jgi:hypothetical protein
MEINYSFFFHWESKKQMQASNPTNTWRLSVVSSRVAGTLHGEVATTSVLPE